jgi:A/G-specific adenine glycosylase
VREALLDWYAERGRELPWRETRDPYAILVSEVMLQQTQASRVVPRWLAWLERWATAQSLAAAATAEVIRVAGLGYNRRAVSLQRAARCRRARLARRLDRAVGRRPYRRPMPASPSAGRCCRWT